MKHKKKIHLKDQLPLESTRTLTPEGYLKATAAITMVGVQLYPASQFGADTDEPVGVFRPPETVFHPETIESIKMKPITMQHPTQDVDADNHGRLSVGSVGESIEPIDEFRLGANIIINEAAVVKNILERNIEELSLGYDSYIVSEEGTYNGEPYFYRFDGPMIVNHLAIVDDGRCGDTVKILDGGDLMNKKQALKFLKDAGLAEDKLAVFMKDAKDDANVDAKLFMEAMKDIDIEGMMPMIVQNLMPMIEKEIKGNKEFMATLAKEIASTMTAAPATAEEVVAPDAEEKTPEELAEQIVEDAKAKEDAVTDAAIKRSKLVDSAKPFIAADKDIHKMKDREILETALTDFIKSDDMKDKTDDYLQGILDSISVDRFAAKKYFKDASKATSVSADISAPVTGMQARHLDDEKT